MLKKVLILAAFMLVMMIPKTDAMKLVTSCGSVHYFKFPEGTTMKEVVELLEHLDQIYCNPKKLERRKMLEDSDLIEDPRMRSFFAYNHI